MRNRFTRGRAFPGPGSRLRGFRRCREYAPEMGALLAFSVRIVDMLAQGRPGLYRPITVIAACSREQRRIPARVPAGALQ